MTLELRPYKLEKNLIIQIKGSKSESNRLLILQALFPQITIRNLSDSNDTQTLQNALSSTKSEINIGHAGTAMRFLTAYFSIQAGREVILTGSEQMQNRPIGILVEALRRLGADISFQKKVGFPPLLIRGKKLLRSSVQLSANISSQYISALMLIAPSFPKGLEIKLQKEPVSFSYIEMTQSLIIKAGFSCEIIKNKIQVFPAKKPPFISIQVEPDWSSASYFHSAIALSDSAEIKLLGFQTPENSIQGDSKVAAIYEQLGVKTLFSEEGIILKKEKISLPKLLKLNLINEPDLAQTIAVTCLGLQIPCELSGLKTLKIKETNRLLALKIELEKYGVNVEISDDSLKMSTLKNFSNKPIEINTYNDHRMAMAFAPLAMKTTVQIKHSEVVSKSYPKFWQDFSKLIKIEKMD